MTHSDLADRCPRGVSCPVNTSHLKTQRWLGRLIDSPDWTHSSLQQREHWLNIYLERL